MNLGQSCTQRKGRETGLCEPVNHLSLVSKRPRRGRILRLIPGHVLGVFRHDALSPVSSNGAQTTYVTGRSFIVGFSSPNIDRHGVHLCGCWGEWCRRPQYRAKRTTETGSREAWWVKSRSDSVLTLQGRCCCPVGGRVHLARGIWRTR